MLGFKNIYSHILDEVYAQPYLFCVLSADIVETQQHIFEACLRSVLSERDSHPRSLPSKQTLKALLEAGFQGQRVSPSKNHTDH